MKVVLLPSSTSTERKYEARELNAKQLPGEGDQIPHLAASAPHSLDNCYYAGHMWWGCTFGSIITEGWKLIRQDWPTRIVMSLRNSLLFLLTHSLQIPAESYSSPSNFTHINSITTESLSSGTHISVSRHRHLSQSQTIRHGERPI